MYWHRQYMFWNEFMLLVHGIIKFVIVFEAFKWSGTIQNEQLDFNKNFDANFCISFFFFINGIVIFHTQNFHSQKVFYNWDWSICILIVAILHYILHIFIILYFIYIQIDPCFMAWVGLWDKGQLSACGTWSYGWTALRGGLSTAS